MGDIRVGEYCDEASICPEWQCEQRCRRVRGWITHTAFSTTTTRVPISREVAATIEDASRLGNVQTSARAEREGGERRGRCRGVGRGKGGKEAINYI